VKTSLPQNESRPYKNIQNKRKKLTPKTPSVFLPISAVFDLVGGIHFSTKNKMKT
jgi:hypothetical protein